MKKPENSEGQNLEVTSRDKVGGLSSKIKNNNNLDKKNLCWTISKKCLRVIS